jgi:hypothetical protein
MNVSKCIIIHWPGSGITHNYGEYIFVEDCAIAHNARWSTGGVHGWNNSKPGTGKKENVNDLKMAARRNLVVASQQCIPSRVTAKGFADLTLDEGGGLHSQAQPVVTADGGVVFGHWQMTDNLVILCGKSGANANATGDLKIERNSFYQNAQNTSSSDIHLSPAKKGEAPYGMSQPVVKNNLVHSLPTAKSINKIGDPALRYEGIGLNYIASGGDPGNADYVINTAIEEVPQVFQDPANFNFKRHSSIPAGQGVDDAIVDWLMQRAEEFDVKLEKCPIITDEAYMAKVKQDIFDSWPVPGVIPSDFGTAFELHDPVTGFEYTYATKHLYPGDPV